MLSYRASSVVAAVLLLGVVLLVKLLAGRSRHKLNLPPGPRPLPIIGTLHLLGKFPQRSLAKLAETYGPLMSIWLGPRLGVVATSPAVAEEMLKTQGLNFSNRVPSSFADMVVPGDVALTNDSLVRLHLKKLLVMHLSTRKQLQLTANLRMEEIARVMRLIPQDGMTVVPVRNHIEVAMTNIMSQAILKKRFLTASPSQEKDYNKQELEHVGNFRQVLMDLTKFGQTINPGDFMPLFKWLDIFGLERQMRKLKERMDAFMMPIILEHMAQHRTMTGLGPRPVKDMADVLLDHMEDENLQQNISIANVTSTLWNAFIASVSTTTDTIEWALAECIRNPLIMERAQAELDTIVGKSRRVEDTDIPNLKYLQAIIKENFRLHPVVPMLLPHMNDKACKVLGYDIPANTPIYINVAAIARDPNRWENPMTFKPERFLDRTLPHDGDHMQPEGQTFEILPFGAGRRQCSGILLASTLVHITVAMFLQSFEWSLPHGLQPRDLDMAEGEGVAHHLAHPLTAILKARLSIP